MLIMDIFTFFQVLIVSFAATSAMTLFSYAISANYGEIYKEPVLLTHLLTRLKFKLSIISKKNLGWLLHFGMGFFFVLSYHFLWLYNILDVSVNSAFILGIISGAISIVCWAIMLKIAKYTFSIDFKGYYLQMFIGYIIFALYSAAAYYIY